MAKQYAVTFEVRGQGSFPLDMLRYDRCYPADTQSSLDLIGRSGRGVFLRHVGPRGWEPTVGRWASFGWDVTFVHRPVEVTE